MKKIYIEYTLGLQNVYLINNNHTHSYNSLINIRMYTYIHAYIKNK